MSNEIQMTKLKAIWAARFVIWTFVILSTFGFRHSSFISAAEPGDACRPAAKDDDFVPVIVNGQVTDDFPAIGFFHTKTRARHGDTHRPPHGDHGSTLH